MEHVYAFWISMEYNRSFSTSHIVNKSCHLLMSFIALEKHPVTHIHPILRLNCMSPREALVMFVNFHRFSDLPEVAPSKASKVPCPVELMGWAQGLRKKRFEKEQRTEIVGFAPDF